MGRQRKETVVWIMGNFGEGQIFRSCGRGSWHEYMIRASEENSL